MNPLPLDVGTANQLLNFAARLDAARADEQLRGAVALHNLLARHGVAYLADEVGMGKTYVALGALALFRHFCPNFRVLVLAPRANIQMKWIKEFGNFVRHNVRHTDLRVKGLDGRPARPLVACHNLVELAHEVCLDANRDFFARLTSFSLPFAETSGDKLRASLKARLPWLSDDLFDLRNKAAFKDNFARALCCALPEFDLVIVDEAHNLKHGFGESVSARNRALGLALGGKDASADPKLFPNYGRRAARVLFLSATPVEETYQHLWNQLDVFGLGADYEGLSEPDADEEKQKVLAGRFLIRRVTSIAVGGKEHTKNLYRREWRRGGVSAHDEPIRVTDHRQRLVVALVQKKVSELLGNERFGASFQIGMLASFESFLETAKLKRAGDDEAANFDDAEQVKKETDELKRDGIDVRDVNKLAKDYRARFDAELPHPKMDALVNQLESAWTTGRKSLVFVRRVASVKELKRKLDDRYDAWLCNKLKCELPDLNGELEALFARYRSEKNAPAKRPEPVAPVAPVTEPTDNEESEAIDDGGGSDTFFEWFFRGRGPEGVVSGATIQRRFLSGSLAPFFEDNAVADVLRCRPAEVVERLARALAVERDRLLAELRNRSRAFLSGAKKPRDIDLFEAVQAAAVRWLHEAPSEHQESARIVWEERFATRKYHGAEAGPPDVAEWLCLPTFFTELRARPDLRESLWPEPNGSGREAFRERATRAQLLASAARLGHAFLDLYAVTMHRIGSFVRGEREDDYTGGAWLQRVTAYLDRLDEQRQTPLAARDWAAFDELADLSGHFDLILDTNAPDARDETRTLDEMAKAFGTLLGAQAPVAGMSGQVNATAVRQFRMPGYPLVLVSTDLLQEGEDLHTFCSSVHHYGIAWTPSAMEQRTGRVDRVRSQTDRRLSGAPAVAPEDMLQVYFPHLEDTVEVLQVHRVLDRMNVFLRLMHEGLVTAGREDGVINAAHEFVRARKPPEQVREVLKTAFPVRPEFLAGESRPVADDVLAHDLRARFDALATGSLPGVAVKWEPAAHTGKLVGTALLGARVQPFVLLLKSVGAVPCVRCVSPVGTAESDAHWDAIRAHTAKTRGVKVGALADDERKYDLTVEGDCLLATAEWDAERVGALVARVVFQADQLEQQLHDGDEPLDKFRAGLESEGDRGD